MADLKTTVRLTLSLCPEAPAEDPSTTLQLKLRITNKGEGALPIDGHPVIGLRLSRHGDTSGRCALRLTPRPGPTVLLEPGRSFEMPITCPRLPASLGDWARGDELRAQVAVRIAGEVLLSTTHEYTMD